MVCTPFFGVLFVLYHRVGKFSAQLAPRHRGLGSGLPMRLAGHRGSRDGPDLRNTDRLVAEIVIRRGIAAARPTGENSLAGNFS